MKQSIEPKRAVYIYDKEHALLKDFMYRKKIKTLRDAFRICVEFTNSHGGLQ